MHCGTIDPATGAFITTVGGTGPCSGKAGSPAAASGQGLGQLRPSDHATLQHRLGRTKFGQNPLHIHLQLLYPNPGGRLPLLQHAHHRRHRRLRIIEAEQNARTLPRQHQDHA
ncbi:MULTISPECIES: hypothetical protein [Streptomyces]|uniref:hypothetical protein n=1 Tax=Streptomyces TaxID=1883 RepID=UPI002E29F1E1|nr:hypothetical protein [Streptomyces sp. NBC_01453]